MAETPADNSGPKAGVGHAFSGAVNMAGSAVSAAGSTVHAVGSAFGSVGKTILGGALRLPGLGRGQHGHRPRPPGAPPGIEQHPDIDVPPAAGTVRVQCIDYSADRVERRDIADYHTLLEEPVPEWATVRWINIDGLHPYVVNRFRLAFNFHTLAAEDILHVPQRPKVEAFPDHVFAVTRMTLLRDEQLRAEQVSILLLGRVVLSFQEREGDCFDPIRARIQRENSRFRQHGGDYLLYALLDAIVDHAFPILEHFGDALEAMEESILLRCEPEQQRQLLRMKRKLSGLRRVYWPMREMVSMLTGSDEIKLAEAVRVHLRDVHDHVIQVLDIIETYREHAAGLNDLYMSAVSNRMNEVMKVLTIIATIFIPLSFIAGLYGMNFEYMPELGYRWAYPIALGSMALAAGGMLYYFWRSGWIGSGPRKR